MYTNNLTNTNISFGAKPIPNTARNFLNKNITEHNSIDVIPHREPDNDSYASAGAIANTLTKLGKKVRIILDGGLPEFFRIDKNVEIIDSSKRKDITPSEITFVVDHSSKSRCSSSLKEYYEKTKPENIIGIDHHDIEDPISKGIYVDTTSRSASELVYDFADSITPLDRKSLTSLYCGILDDCRKSGFIKIKNKDGMPTVAMKDNLPPETKEVIENIEKRLPHDTLIKARKLVDTLSNLSPQEKEFRKSLFEKINFTPNKKFAYVVIPPEDRVWQALGQDTDKTSPILSDFRQRIIKNSPNDSFISKIDSLSEKLKDVQAVAVFYRGKKSENPANERFKMSVHSKGPQSEIVTTTLNENGFKGGGHPDRAGARCLLKDWQSFVDAALSASEKFK